MHVSVTVAFAFVLVGCASVQLDPQKAVATTLAPFNAQLGVNRVTVPEGARLLGASVDGKPAFCTQEPAWFALGESRSVCFTDEGKTGYLDKYYVLGTLRSLTYEAHIPYTIDAGATVGSSAPENSVLSAFPPEIQPRILHFLATTSARNRTLLEAAIAQCVYDARLAVPVNASGVMIPQQLALVRACFQAKDAAIRAGEASRLRPTLWD